MDLPTSAEGLTKLLRGRDTTPEQIYEIVSRFDTLGFYFPNKEIFITELIIDRWNDVKKVEFREDARTWEIFNSMWDTIHDDIILKNMFKRLKFVPLLDSVLNSESIDVNKILPNILQTCKLVNSTTTMEVSFDHACKILANSLDIMLKVDHTIISDTQESSFIREIIRLIGFENIGEQNYKMSVSFCNDLLLSVIRYTSYIEENSTQRSGNEVTQILSDYFGEFIFGKEIDSLLLLEKFFSKNKQTIDASMAIILFQESNKFLIKSDFQKLETVFEYIVSIQPNVTAVLLSELAASKKTLSHNFLKKLFDQTLQLAKEKSLYDDEFWQLIGNMLDLDLEIGIENNSKLMELLEDQRHTHPTNETLVVIWKKFLQCYINAREFEKFLDDMKKYCLKNVGFVESTIFLNDKEFTNEISKNIVTLSTTQLIAVFSNITEQLLSQKSDEMTIRIAKIYMNSLQSISYTILPEIRNTFVKLFSTTSANDKDLWGIKYMIMQTYDDIIPVNQIDASFIEQIEDNLKQNGSVSKELLLFVLKLREYEDFDVSILESKILDFINKSENEERENLLLDVFGNWSSIVNSLFSRDTIQQLTKIIALEFSHILKVLFMNDDFFEEENIMFQLVSNLVSDLSSASSVEYLCVIPIECLNKKNRISIIDEITDKKSFERSDLVLLEHLLSAPTFKSRIESDFDSLLSVLSKSQMFTTPHTMTFDIFDKILKNHMLQIKETTSESFISTLNQKINEGINKKEFSRIIFSMAISFVTQTQNADISLDVSVVVEKLIQWTQLFMNDKKTDNSVWVILALHKLLSGSVIQPQIQEKIKKLALEVTKENVFKTTDISPLMVPMFLLYSLTFDSRLEVIFSQYIVMRDSGIAKTELITALEGIIARKASTNEIEVKEALYNTIISLRDNASATIYSSILELVQVQFSKLSADGDETSKLFVFFLSELLTNLSNLSENLSDILDICKMIQNVQITRPRMLTQYGTEILFPLCYKINSMAVESKLLGDQLYVASSKIISNILNFHRTKLSNRYHLINTFLCESLSLFSNNQIDILSGSSAGALGRLIVNFCEPTISSTSNSKHLSSNTGVIKKNVRRYAPALLVKYVHLCITSNLNDEVRKELTPAMYSILDLISQNELNLLGKVLDNAGRQYFKVLYAEYKRLGKWHER